MSSLTDWLRLEKEGEDARGAQVETEPASEGFDLGRYVDSLLEPELSNASLPALQRRLHEALAELQKQKAAAQSELSDARIHADDAANKRAERARALSEEVSNLFGRFGALDQHIADLSRSSAHVGDRLHSAQHQRQRSEQISHDVLHLQRFASFDGSLSSLSHPFNDPSLLTDSALPARRLLDIARDINRNANPPPIPSAESNLEKYCEQVENQLLERFFNSERHDNIVTMSTLADALVAMNGGRSVIRRYIATRPMFMHIRSHDDSPSPLNSSHPPKSYSDASAQAAASVRALALTFDEIVESVKSEAERIKQVFPNPGDVLSLLVQRVMEQRVEEVLEFRVPQMPSQAKDNGKVHLLYLEAVVGAHQRAMDLGSSIAQMDYSVADSVERAQGLFVKAHEVYTKTELAYLRHRCNERFQHSNDPMDPDDASALLSWHSSSLRRCESFISQGIARAEAGQEITQEFLLSEFRTRVKWPVSRAIPDTEKVRSSADLKRGSQALGSQFVQHPLHSVGIAFTHMRSLDNHLRDHCAQLFDDAPNSYAAVQDDALGLAREVEDVCAKAFEDIAATVETLIDKIWANEQKRNDFKPSNNDASLKPTAACKRVTSLLTAVNRILSSNIDASNAASFGALVTSTFANNLKIHVHKFSYTMTGGLRLKQDLSEYIAAAEIFQGSSAAISSLNRLAEACNLLVVQSGSVPGMLDNGFSIGAQEAEKLVQLRSS